MRVPEVEVDPAAPAVAAEARDRGHASAAWRKPPPTLVASSAMAWAERCAAAAGLAVLGVPLAGALTTVRILSGRPPLVAHKRIGWTGEPFWVLKIRTMWNRGSGEQAGTQGRGLASWVEYLPETEVPVIKRGPDPRVTSAFACFCRRFSIDELPQLLHVVSGKMRLVGPRPLTQCELDLYYGDAAWEVLGARPGITGLWQVMGRNHLTYPQRRRLDLFFVRRMSLRLYWRVLLRTPWCVLSGAGVW